MGPHSYTLDQQPPSLACPLALSPSYLYLSISRRRGLPSSLSSSEPERAILFAPGFDELSQYAFLLYFSSAPGQLKYFSRETDYLQCCNCTLPLAIFHTTVVPCLRLDLFRPVHTLEGISLPPLGHPLTSQVTHFLLLLLSVDIGHLKYFHPPQLSLRHVFFRAALVFKAATLPGSNVRSK